MRKVSLLIAVLLMAVPAMAATVAITCTPNDTEGSVTVSYSTDGTLIRGFGLSVTLDPNDDPNVAITQVDVLDPNYRIYPSQIEIDGSDVTSYGTCYDPCDLGDANLGIEMGSLYTFDANYQNDANAGYGMQPGQVGTLLKFYVSADCNYTIDVDAATGGIVLEDPNEAVTKSTPLCSGHVAVPPDDCMAITHPDHDNWVYWEKPPCWCYPRQCRGDVDGLKFANVFWVSGNDLNLLKQSINKPEISLPDGSECSDLDHLKFANVFWVSGNDLNIMKGYINKPEPSVPVCSGPGTTPGHDANDLPNSEFNFWCSPAGCPAP